MKLLFKYTKDKNGNISNLKPISPEKDNASMYNFTYGDSLLFSCLKKCNVGKDGKSINFTMEYDNTMVDVFNKIK